MIEGNKRSNSSISEGFHAPNIINQANINLNRREKALLKLGPKYIPHNPHLAHIRIKNEIEVVVKKINKIFVEHGWVLPRTTIRNLYRFTRKDSYLILMVNTLTSIQLKEINNLRNKIEATQTVIRKTDKSKVFHLGKLMIIK